jgi:prepilin-type N-terminal cleavage/methylation domain-containing protein
LIKVSSNSSGFTLFELIVVVAIMGMTMISIQQILGQFLSTHADTREKLEQVSHARFALDRIVMLITETGRIKTPEPGSSTDELVIEERIMDAYTNSTTGSSLLDTPDGVLDADKDSDLVVNADDPDDVVDPVDWITIYLDKTEPNNWKLMEVMPNYETADDDSDGMDPIILCENVTAFLVTRGSSDGSKLIKINLDLGGNKNQVSFTTSAIAGHFLFL